MSRPYLPRNAKKSAAAAPSRPNHVVGIKKRKSTKSTKKTQQQQQKQHQFPLPDYDNSGKLSHLTFQEMADLVDPAERAIMQKRAQIIKIQSDYPHKPRPSQQQKNLTKFKSQFALIHDQWEYCKAAQDLLDEEQSY